MPEDNDQVNSDSGTFGRSLTEKEEAISFAIPAPSVNGFMMHRTRTGVRIAFVEWPNVGEMKEAEYVRSAITLSLADAASLHLMLEDLLKPHPEAIATAKEWAMEPQKDAE